MKKNCTFIKKAISLITSSMMIASLFVTMPVTTVSAADGNTATTTAGITNGNHVGPSDVGIWYCPYIYTPNWPSWGSNPSNNYQPLTCDGTYHQFGLTSGPISQNAQELDYELEQMANAKIDFILLDETNGGEVPGYMDGNANLWDTVADQLVARIKVWNDNHSWKLRYAFAIGSYGAVRVNDSLGLCIEKQCQAIFQRYINNTAIYNNDGSNNYYTLNGKPLVVIFDDGDPAGAGRAYNGTYSSQCTLRNANGQVGSYGWAQYTQQNNEVEVLTPGWNNHAEGFTPIDRAFGDAYVNAWNTAISAPPTIVMIASFNDWMEETAIWKTDTTNCNNFYEQQWYGHDGLLHPTMYWDYTVGAINSLRTGGILPAMEGSSTAPSSLSGHVDEIHDNQNGGIYLRGWAYDSNQSDASLRIDVYIGAGENNEVGMNTYATVERTDINNAFGIPGNHGFDINLSTGNRGDQRVVVYAIPAGSGMPIMIWDGNINITDSDPVLPPTGCVDEISANQNGGIYLRGWAYDPNATDTSIDVHVYIGGSAGESNVEGINTGATSTYRPDVNNAFGLTGNHGFDLNLTTSKRGNQRVVVYGISASGTGPTILWDGMINIT
ncbi:MAG: hypothetical protein LBI03_06160 [Clostridiales bacterium]|nr:hypothetical protein [Clostridiales bacterium]